MNLGEMTAVETAEAVRTGKISALEVCDATIDRIEAADGPINAVVVRDFDRARAAAKALDANGAKGSDKLLIGVSMTVKESNNVAGLPTTWGFPDHAIKASTGNAFTRSSTPSTEPASSSRSDQTAGRTGIGPLSSLADGGDIVQFHNQSAGQQVAQRQFGLQTISHSSTQERHDRVFTAFAQSQK